MSDVLALAGAINNLADAIRAVQADTYDGPTPPTKTRAPAQVEEEEPAPRPKAKPKAKPVEDEDDTTLDYTRDIKDLIPAMTRKHGRDVVVALLNSFTGEDGEPCTKGPQVLEEDWPALKAKLDKLVKKPAPAAEDDD